MRKYQQGLSYWSVMFGICFLAFMIKVSSTVAPIYLEFYTINEMLKAKFRDPKVDQLDIKQFTKDLRIQMETNNMHDRSIEDLFVIKKDNNKMLVEMDYEERKNFISNLDVVARFKKNYTTDKPDGYTP